MVSTPYERRAGQTRHRTVRFFRLEVEQLDLKPLVWMNLVSRSNEAAKPLHLKP